MNIEEESEVSFEEVRDKSVRAMIFLRLNVENSDEVAREVASYVNVEDVFLVTGNEDMAIKAYFDNYDELKEFLTMKLNQIDGVKDSKSMMIVSSYKERNEFIKAEDVEEKEEEE